MKVLLIASPVQHSIAGNPVLSLLWIAACLRRDGYTVEYLDAANKRIDLSDIIGAALRFKPDIIGVTCTNLSYLYAQKIISCLKQVNPNVITIMGGAHMNLMKGKGKHPALTENPDLDYVNVGDGFNSIQKIKGLPKRSVIYGGFIDINTLPAPAWDLINPLDYTGNFPLIDYPSLSITTGFGCPFRCIWCCLPKDYKKARFRDPEMVVRDLKQFVSMGVKGVTVFDDEFNLDVNHARDVCQAIIDAGLHKVLKFEALMRTTRGLVPESLIKLMSKAGFVKLMWGCESGSNTVLRAIRKGTTVEDNERALRLAHKYGIKNFHFTVIQNPQETWEEILITAKYIKRNRKFIDWIQIHAATPYESTELRRMADKGNWIINYDENSWVNTFAVMNTPWLTAKQADKARELILYHYDLGKRIRSKNLLQVRKYPAWIKRIARYAIANMRGKA